MNYFIQSPNKERKKILTSTKQTESDKKIFSIFDPTTEINNLPLN
jgi:hypothetical protein